MPQICLIAAVAQDGAIGRNQQLLCHLPNDLKHFKNITSGHPVIMGRKTFDSLPNGALPNRENLIITRDSTLERPGAITCHSLQQAINLCPSEQAIFIIGGAAIYQEAISMADKLYITHIHQPFADADCYFPSISTDIWQVESEEPHEADDRNKYDYTFTLYTRR